MDTGSEITVSEVPLEKTWDVRHRVMYPELTLAEMRLPDDADGIHLGLHADGMLVSIVSVFNRGSSLQFRRFATELVEQGKGYGTLLLQYVMDYAAAGDWSIIWCNARQSASAFYQRFGMEPAGEPWHQLGHDFIRMEKELK